MTIRPIAQDDTPQWLALRLTLWPETDELRHWQAMADIVAEPERCAAFVCSTPEGVLLGFAEVSLRAWAEGCSSSPVGYLEGWFVRTQARGQGIGRALARACEDWARAQGCREMVSDTDLGNAASEAAHLALGYEVVGRVVAFRKEL